jgi:hypothetical protein
MKKTKTRKEKKYKLIIYLNWGLANRIFQIISAMGFAERWNMNLYISPNYINNNDHKPFEKSIEEIKQLFPNLKVLNKKYDTSNFFKIEKSIIQAYQYMFIKNPKQDTILYGQFENEKFFPKKHIELHLVEPKDSIIKGYDDLFFIHFRLGDYKDLIHKIFDVDLVNYYKYCVVQILKKYKNANFIVLSNDIEKAKDYIKDNLFHELINNKVIYDEHGTRLDDLYYMSKCKGGICANSTFSWFGAYSIKKKNKDIIFMPNKWLDFKIFDMIGKIIVPSDGIYPDWVTKVPLYIKIKN